MEARLAQVERIYLRPDESAAARARRQFSDGETQLLLGDWLHASVLLYGALDEAEFRASADAPPALLYLGDALRNQGACGAALSAYEELLRQGPSGMQAAALIGTLDCRIKLKRLDGIQPLLDAGPGPAQGRAAGRARLPGRQGRLLPHRPPAGRAAGAGHAGLRRPWRRRSTWPPPTSRARCRSRPATSTAAAERFEACLTLQGNDAEAGGDPRAVRHGGGPGLRRAGEVRRVARPLPAHPLHLAALQRGALRGVLGLRPRPGTTSRRCAPPP